MEGSGNSHGDICRDGGSSRVDAERCGDADTDSVGREEVDRALQEADQEGGREEHCRERPGTQLWMPAACHTGPH